MGADKRPDIDNEQTSKGLTNPKYFLHLKRSEEEGLLLRWSRIGKNRASKGCKILVYLRGFDQYTRY